MQTNRAPYVNLNDQGYRFVRRGDYYGWEYNWVHPLEVRSGDFDCTDMTDTEFLADVKAHTDWRLQVAE